MSRQVSVTVKIDGKEYDTIILNEFGPLPAYLYDLISYTSTHIKYNNLRLPISISLQLPVKVIESLDLPISERARKQRIEDKRIEYD